LPRQKRRRRGPAELPGRRRTKLPFPINLIFNVKAFYIFFIIIMIASMAAVGFASGSGTSNIQRPDIIDEELDDTEPTPPSNVFPDGPPRTIDGTKPHTATLVTNQGEIVIELSTDAPDVANSFAFLAAKGFYNDTAFFYVDHQYFAQGGDPTCQPGLDTVCTGVGGPGYSLPLENPEGKHLQWSIVAPTLAEGGQDVHGSQFRILYTADDRLDGKETVFGEVTEGQEILEALADFKVCSVVTADDCSPSLDATLVIQDVIIEES
jgi:cyclophilin family peptidyl-prolyl cis-trans isomerase